MEWFADTWFYVALLDRRDSHHERAVRVLSRIPDARNIVTHDSVLGEVLTHFGEDGTIARLTAVERVRSTIRDSNVRPAGREFFLLALDLYAARADKEYSLVDCMSMFVMEQRGIRHVLTNDHHFTQAGFIIVNQ